MESPQIPIGSEGLVDPIPSNSYKLNSPTYNIIIGFFITLVGKVIVIL